jgi:outer membrane protein assembly factor BamB
VPLSFALGIILGLTVIARSLSVYLHYRQERAQFGRGTRTAVHVTLITTVVATSLSFVAPFRLIGTQLQWPCPNTADRWNSVTGETTDANASPTPQKQPLSIYVASPSGDIYALRADNGMLRWRSHIQQIRTQPWFGQAVKVPLTERDGVVYVSTAALGGSLYALRASDGTILWHHQTGVPEESPVVANGVVYLYVTSTARQGPASAQWAGIYAVAASDGHLLWRFQPDLSFGLSFPVVANGVVYLQSLGGEIYALQASDGAILWRHHTGGSVSATSTVVVNGIFYTAGVSATRTSDGDLLWKDPMAFGGVGVPVVVNNVVYVISRSRQRL